MRCDRYEYSSERIDTDVPAIDAIEDQYSLSTTNLEKSLLEDDTLLLLEDGDYVIDESNIVLASEVSADNVFIGQKIITDDILDFSEKNTFADSRTF
jgi:hypothetical protein